MKTIIAGSRTCVDPIILLAAIAKAPFIVTSVVCGMAVGADTLGEFYAINNGLSVHYYPADWANHGRSAGHIRNEQMAQNAEALIALWDGISPGTKNMIKIAKQYGLRVFVFDYSKTSKHELEEFFVDN